MFLKSIIVSIGYMDEFQEKKLMEKNVFAKNFWLD